LHELVEDLGRHCLPLPVGDDGVVEQRLQQRRTIQRGRLGHGRRLGFKRGTQPLGHDRLLPTRLSNPTRYSTRKICLAKEVELMLIGVLALFKVTAELSVMVSAPTENCAP